MAVTPISDKDARVAIIHTDITDLQFSKERHSDRLQQFARRLINAQEAERLKISREIHDNLGNRIALMAFSVRQIMKQRSKNPAASMAELNKVLEDVTDLSAALRDFSHGLHPPLLRYVGVSAALKSLGEEFGKALGIGMEIKVPANLGRLPEEVELCIFRISQECLQNIAKHSEASSASIVLERTDGDIRLTVSDSGRGFIRSSAMEKGGLGLVSMEERALCLGGSLSVNSSPGRGTAIHVTIPLAQDSVQALTV
jgi:two-component system sensor histidine kinase UhpB